MIRHLVMPNNVAGSEKIMEWIAENLPKDTYVNIMAQYTPDFKAYDYPEISRRITSEEYSKVVKRAQEMGLTNLDIQGYWWIPEKTPFWQDIALRDSSRGYLGIAGRIHGCSSSFITYLSSCLQVETEGAAFQQLKSICPMQIELLLGKFI